MLGYGVLSRHVLCSCKSLSRYICSSRHSGLHTGQRPYLALNTRRWNSLSSEAQHAKQGTRLVDLSYRSHQLAPRCRSIHTSISCQASQPKTVRDIVRELKKGKASYLASLHLSSLLCPSAHISVHHMMLTCKGIS